MGLKLAFGDTAESARTGGRPGRGGHRAKLVLLIACSAALLSFDFGAGILATNDEARFPTMARDILTRGHWLLPEIDGVPMLNKPPLQAWLIALAAWPTGGVTQRTAAMPSLLAALGMIVATYWVGRRLFDPDVGIIAGLILATTAGVFSLARSPVPDMTLSLVVVAAVGAFVSAERERRRANQTVFYLLIAVGWWTKGPAAFLALAIVLAYALTTYGWSGLRRLASWPGLALLGLAVASWLGLALGAGRAAFVREVVLNDYVRPYFLAAGPRKPWSLLGGLDNAVTILLPWTLLLPVALWWALRDVAPEWRRGARVVLVWTSVVFVITAASARQRWRYHLPLCAPVALLLGAWLRSRRWRWRTATFGAAWVLVAASLAVGQALVTARQLRLTDWRAIARAAAESPGPLYALDAPEIVFEFYLGRPVKPTPDYETFARLPDARQLLVPEREMSRLRGSGQMRELADGLLVGRRFVLLGKQGAPTP